MMEADVHTTWPGKFEVLNRAIAGDRTVNLLERLQQDCIDLKPDYLSVLIGVNDAWHTMAQNDKAIPDAESRKIYGQIIEDILAALPLVKIYLLEPFALKVEQNSDCWEAFQHEVLLRAETTRVLAKKYGLTFIPLQAQFDSLCRIKPADYWLSDGVHPTAAGHEVIKKALMAAIGPDLEKA